LGGLKIKDRFNSLVNIEQKGDVVWEGKVGKSKKISTVRGRDAENQAHTDVFMACWYFFRLACLHTSISKSMTVEQS